MIRTTGLIRDDEISNKLSNLIQNKLAAIQEKRVAKISANNDYLGLWVRKLKEHYPKSFVGSISAQQRNIFLSIVNLYNKECSDSFEDFVEWVMVFWPQLSKLTRISFFDTKPYPCIDTFCRNYKAIINAKISLESKVVLPESPKTYDYYGAVRDSVKKRKRVTLE